jgi:hypothetical protein
MPSLYPSSSCAAIALHVKGMSLQNKSVHGIDAVAKAIVCLIVVIVADNRFNLWGFNTMNRIVEQL